jgi:hypothetical protein
LKIACGVTAITFASKQNNETRRIGANIAQVVRCAAADVEGHSEAAKFGEQGRLSASVNVRASEMKEAAN